MLGFIFITSFIFNSPYDWVLCEDFGNREECFHISDNDYPFEALDFQCTVTSTKEGEPFETGDYSMYFRTINCRDKDAHQVITPLGCVFGPQNADKDDKVFLKLISGEERVVLSLQCKSR